MGQLKTGGANFGDTGDADALDRRFHGLDQRENQLVKSNQTEAQGGGARERQPLAQLIKRQQEIGPVVSRSEHVPGTEDGGIEMPFPDHLFALGAHGDVVLHYGNWSRMRDAKIDEVMDAELSAGGDGFAGGDQVNGAKLGSFRWRWVRGAD